MINLVLLRYIIIQTVNLCYGQKEDSFVYSLYGGCRSPILKSQLDFKVKYLHSLKELEIKLRDYDADLMYTNNGICMIGNPVGSCSA